MRDYPSLIKNLKINKHLDEIASKLDKKGLILKGTIDSNGSKIIFEKSNKDTFELDNIEHNAYEYLPTRQKEQLKEIDSMITTTIEEDMDKRQSRVWFGGGIVLGALTLSPLLFQSSWAFPAALVMGGYEVGMTIDMLKIGKLLQLRSLLELDKWFSENLQNVNDEVKEGEALFERLSDESKEIIRRPNIAGGITLNNIQEFPVDDLKMIMYAIETKKKLEERNKQKSLKQDRGYIS